MRSVGRPKEGADLSSAHALHNTSRQWYAVKWMPRDALAVEPRSILGVTWKLQSVHNLRGDWALTASSSSLFLYCNRPVTRLELLAVRTQPLLWLRNNSKLGGVQEQSQGRLFSLEYDGWGSISPHHMFLPCTSYFLQDQPGNMQLEGSCFSAPTAWQCSQL